jgi:glutamate/tyrosine decarboxylase-like PLP-dependent enzyme
MNVVCFALREESAGNGSKHGEAAVQTFVQRVRDAGDVFVTPTTYRGRWGLRAAFSNWRTSQADVERVFAALENAVDQPERGNTSPVSRTS